MIEFKLPDIGEGLVEAQIVRWYVKEGQKVEENQPLVEILTDKANVEIPSPTTGIVAHILVKEGEIAKVGSTIVKFKPLSGESKETMDIAKESEISGVSEEVKQQEQLEVSKSEAISHTAKILAAPAVRKLAKEKGILLEKVKGSGPQGRILLKDLEPYLKPSLAQVPTTQIFDQKNVEEFPIKGILKAMYERMSLANRNAAIFTFVEECDVTELVAVREKVNETLKQENIKLTYLPFILKAVAIALKSFPKLNATIDEEKMVLKIRKDINIGIAMSVDNSLLVPVIRDVDKKNIVQLASEISNLAELAKANKLKPEHFKDGGFSVTSLGKLGGLLATPIVNYPQVSILGVHKIYVRPVYIQDKLQPRYIMNLSISSDHRVIEGQYAASFLYEVIKYLQNPNLLLISLV
jgi:pyruvate dehydrogenase E2 component (dihydrolipoamide acetyltransferase)